MREPILGFLMRLLARLIVIVRYVFIKHVYRAVVHVAVGRTIRDVERCTRNDHEPTP